VAGLICAALGLKKGSQVEAHTLAGLASAPMLSITIPKTRPILRMQDFQTVLGTRRASNKLNEDPVVTRRDYLLEIGRACQDHNTVVEHRPPRQPCYGGHIERGFRTWLTRAHRLKGTTFPNVEQKGDYDSERRAVMTRAELEKWFTIYVAKVYANTFHKGINTTPLAKYKEGILGTDNRAGIGLPDRVAEPTAFMLDFMPFEERTIQEYGVVIDHIFFWDDALRPWIHACDPKDVKRAQIHL
jgi:putative transposase